MSSNERTDHAPNAAAAQALPRRSFFNDMPDKGLFGLMAFTGFILIFLFKQRGFDANLIAALAVSAMIVYGAAAYRLPAIGLRPDRLGDNFYYLGFIYTLASLSASLFQLRYGLSIDELLGSFGIALITTIAGIVGRVMFVQMRGNLDDIEEQVRVDLLEKSQHLHAQLSASVREFETMRTSFLQTLSETTEACTNLNKQHTTQVEILAHSVTKRIEAVFEAKNAALERLTKASEDHVKAIETIGRRTEAIEIPTERLNTQIADFGQKLETQILDLGKHIETVGNRVATMELPSAKLSEQIAGFGGELDAVVQRLAESIDDRLRVTERRRWWNRRRVEQR